VADHVSQLGVNGHKGLLRLGKELTLRLGCREQTGVSLRPGTEDRKQALALPEHLTAALLSPLESPLLSPLLSADAEAEEDSGVASQMNLTASGAGSLHSSASASRRAIRPRDALPSAAHRPQRQRTHQQHNEAWHRMHSRSTSEARPPSLLPAARKLAICCLVERFSLVLTTTARIGIGLQNQGAT
jgi:hypothetical protein